MYMCVWLNMCLRGWCVRVARRVITTMWMDYREWACVCVFLCACVTEKLQVVWFCVRHSGECRGECRISATLKSIGVITRRLCVSSCVRHDWFCVQPGPILLGLASLLCCSTTASNNHQTSPILGVKWTGLFTQVDPTMDSFSYFSFVIFLLAK